MPNRNQNKLTVEGPRERIEAWREAQRGTTATYHGDEPVQSDFTFNAQVPVPAETLSAEYSNTDITLMILRKQPLPEGLVLSGYDWQVKNWGTKWDTDPTEVDEDWDDDDLVLTFDTAWSPPVAWLLSMSDLWPDLKFVLAFIELGMAFAGSVSAENGVYAEETHGVTNDDLEEWGYEPDEDDDEDEAPAVPA